MSPLTDNDAAIKVYFTAINVYFNENPNDIKKRQTEEIRPSKNSNCFLSFIEKFRKLLNADEFIRWKWNSDFFHLRKIPFFILFISIVEVLVYYVADDRLREIFLYDTVHKKEIWRFLTYMLLHTDAIHLTLNILIQGLLGTPIECEQGPIRSAAIYFGGGLAGSLGASVFATFPLMAGASGGVYALLTSQIPNVVLNYSTLKYAGYRIAAVVVLVASDVIYILCHVYFYNNERPRIGWVAHASGAAAGILLGFLLFSGTSKWKIKFRVTSCVILVLPSLMVAAFAWRTLLSGCDPLF